MSVSAVRGSRVGVLTVPPSIDKRGRTCVRCGHTMAYSGRGNVAICRDCRVADPTYVAMVTGQR